MVPRKPLPYLILFTAARIAVTGPVPGSSAAADGSEISIVRVPQNGIQSQAVVDPAGVVHLIYLEGDPAASDIYYVRKDPGAAAFSKPILVNSKPSSASITEEHADPGPSQDRKHPVVLANQHGETLLAWTEGTAWQRGGTVAWQLFDSAGHAVGSKGDCRFGTSSRRTHGLTENYNHLLGLSLPE